MLKSPAYTAIAGANLSPWSKRVTGKILRICRLEAEQTVPGRLAAPDNAGGMLMYAMNVDPAAEAEFNAWYNEEHVPALAAVPGCLMRAPLQDRRRHAQVHRALPFERARSAGIKRVEESRRHAVDGQDAPAFSRSAAHRAAALRPRCLIVYGARRAGCIAAAPPGAQSPVCIAQSVHAQPQYPAKAIRIIVPLAAGGESGLVSRRPVRGKDEGTAGFYRTATAIAQPYPVKSIRIVVPLAAGGPSDLLARTLGQKFTETWGQPVVIDNRAGANGVVGAELVAKSAPDGYTLLMGTSGTHGINASLFPKLPYDTINDFAPIARAGVAPYVLVAHPSLPVRGVPELVRLARAKPGQITIAAGGSASHLAAELFKSLARIDLLLVPYKGNSLAVAAVIGGEISLVFGNIAQSAAAGKSGTPARPRGDERAPLAGHAGREDDRGVRRDRLRDFDVVRHARARRERRARSSTNSTPRSCAFCNCRKCASACRPKRSNCRRIRPISLRR